jgi:hypothetical protein
MVKANLLGKMGHIMKETLLMGSFRGSEDIILLSWINTTKENLELEIWKVKGLRHGLMAGDMREISRMERKMEKAHLNGQME